MHSLWTCRCFVEQTKWTEQFTVNVPCLFCPFELFICVRSVFVRNILSHLQWMRDSKKNRVPVCALAERLNTFPQNASQTGSVIFFGRTTAVERADLERAPTGKDEPKRPRTTTFFLHCVRGSCWNLNSMKLLSSPRVTGTHILSDLCPQKYVVLNWNCWRFVVFCQCSKERYPILKMDIETLSVVKTLVSQCLVSVRRPVSLETVASFGRLGQVQHKNRPPTNDRAENHKIFPHASGKVTGLWRHSPLTSYFYLQLRQKRPDTFIIKCNVLPVVTYENGTSRGLTKLYYLRCCVPFPG